MLLILPLAIPLATGVLALLLRRRARVQRGLGVLGAAGLLGVAGVLFARVQAEGVVAAQMGGWPAPFGITLVADGLSSVLLVAAAVAALAVMVYAVGGGVEGMRERFGFYPLVHFLLVGVNGAFLTGDLFNLYVWFEVLLIASFVLLILGNGTAQLDGAVKYVAINLVASVSFLVGVGLLYGTTGALNLADLAVRAEATGLRGSGLEAALASLFFIAFGIKAALFPLFFWMPAAYHTAPTPIAALFAGLLTKVGLYALVRMFTLVFAAPAGYTQGVLLWAAGLTMLAGVLGALVERRVQRLLAFLVISAMGYILMGLALATEAGLAGTVFYAVQDVLVKTTLFLLAGLMVHATGADTLDRMGGLYARRPLLALGFVVPAFSLAGFPPFPGFWGKLALVRAAFAAGQPVLAGVALLAGALTLLVVGQLWSRVFWRAAPDAAEAADGAAAKAADETTADETTQSSLWQRAPVAALVLVVLSLGLWAQPLYGVSARAAAALVDVQGYLDAVLGS